VKIIKVKHKNLNVEVFLCMSAEAVRVMAAGLLSRAQPGSPASVSYASSMTRYLCGGCSVVEMAQAADDRQGCHGSVTHLRGAESNGGGA
jgi:hypothetical protein